MRPNVDDYFSFRQYRVAITNYATTNQRHLRGALLDVRQDIIVTTNVKSQINATLWLLKHNRQTEKTMFTVIIKLFLSDKCNWDWMQSCKHQHQQAIKELKDFASEFDRKLHCAVISSATLERDEAFCEVIYEATMPDDLQMKIESVVQLLAQDVT